MINQTVKLFIVALLMLTPCISFALPGAHDPVTGGKSYTCTSCHSFPNKYGNSDLTYDVNLCISCHKSGDPKSSKHFTVDDFANVYKNAGVVVQPNPNSTSHKWFGSDNVPAAGAVPPIDTRGQLGLNKKGLTGTISCARCHSVHGSSGTDSNNSPYLRMANDSDQLCLSCHRLRDTQDHKTGSHPVNVVYTSAKVKAVIADPMLYPVSFLATPKTNPTNSTGEVKLKNGKIVCSTCHGVHNTDSNSATVDTFGQATSSKGYLLRVDAYGATPNDTNICTNCHVTKNHNINSKNGFAVIVCMDCHSGHVEYDAAAAGKPSELVPNVSLVRRYLQYSSSARINKRVFYRSDTVKEYYNTTGNGLCQGCHQPPVTHRVGGIVSGAFPAPANTNCIGCHMHGSALGAFKNDLNGSCNNSCHGLPPVVTSGLNGPAAGYTKFNEATTPHASHTQAGGPNANVFDCNECHNGYDMANNSISSGIADVFVTTRSLPGATAQYVNGNCLNVYCHSNGKGSWNPGMNPIAWGNNKRNTIIGLSTECVTCHKDPNDTVGHAWHAVARTYPCITCHANTVLDNTTLRTDAKILNGAHLNKVADIKFSGLGSAIGTSCSNVACHSNGKGAAPIITPSWAIQSSGQCGACHLTQVTTPVLASGSHTIHYGIINAGTDASVVCAKCHIYTIEQATTHVDGTIQVNYGLTGCGVCHASPYSAAPATPAWGSLSTGCGSCHTGVGAFTGTGSSPNTGSHTKHMALVSPSCGQCHAGAQSGVTGGVGHLNTYVDVTGGYPLSVVKHAPGFGYGVCNNSSCHISPYGTQTVVSPGWGSSAGCVSCHTGVGAFTGTNGAPNTGSHNKHLALPATNCSVCHSGAVANVNGGAAHADGDVDVTLVGYATNVVKHTSGSGYVSCSNASAAGCHVNPYSASPLISPTWGLAAGCAACHTATGAFTGTGSGPNTGSHNKHMALQSPSCGQCHSGASATSGGNAHIDGNVDVSGVTAGYTPNVTKHAGAPYSGTCSTTACHLSSYGTAEVVTPTWGVASGCISCHTGVGAFTGTGTGPNTGSHNKHMAAQNAACNQCHTGASLTSGGDAHINGKINVGGVTLGYTANITKHAAGTYNGTCSTTTCHVSSYDASEVTTPTWGVSAGCVSCHTGTGAFTGTNSAPNTGSHNKHMAVQLAACNQCHSGATTTSGGNSHLDGNIDVLGITLGYTANVTKHTAGSYGGTCSTTTCHVSSYGTAEITTPTWGLAAGCVSCHTGVGAFTGTNNGPNTGSHNKHMALLSSSCGQCHSGASATSGGNAHTDGNVDVSGITAGYTANITKHAAGTYGGTCTTTACHFSSYGTAEVKTPTWGVASGCASCHTGVGAFTGTGSAPNTGAHNKHLALVGVVCNQCHTGAVANTTGGTFHLDTNIDVVGGYTLNVTKHTSGTYTGTCSTTACHGTTGKPANWGAVTTNDYCTRCHGTSFAGTVNSTNRDLIAPSDVAGIGTGKVSTNVKIGAHETHLKRLNGFSNYSTVDYRCESCHGTLPLASTYTHADGSSSPVGKYKNIANNWGKMVGQTYVSQTCSNTYCHNPAGTNGTLNASNAGTGILPVWTNATYIADGTKKTAANCNQCHKVPGAPNFVSGFNHTALTDNTYVVTQDCSACHGHNGDTAGNVGERHMDGIKHGGGASCNGCHGYPPLTAAEIAANPGKFVDALPTANSSHHAKHLLPTVTIAQGSAPCLPCHPYGPLHGQGGSTVIRSNVQVNEAADTGYRFDSNRPKRYNATTKTCSNISCHFQPTTAW